MIDLHATGIALRFDPAFGQLRDLVVTDGGHAVAPLHLAPWVGKETMPADASPHLGALGGDFFCAPFGAQEGSSPLHGWPANARWVVVAEAPGLLRAVLERPVFGATIIKELTLRDGHPFVYQRHILVGGEGRLPVANHANLALHNGALIRTSRKSHWETPRDALEPDPARGRSALTYPARADDPARFPGRDGPVDLTRYPFLDRHEEFVVGVEAAGNALGWTGVTRAEGDLFLSLRDPAALPMTMLWHSNGGRDYAPWSGRHTGCLGVEEGAAAPLLGVSTEADLSGPGALTLRPGGTAEVRHVLGAIRWPADEPLADARPAADSLTLVGEAGTTREVPFRGAFLAPATAGA